MLQSAVRHAFAHSELFSDCDENRVTYRLQAFDKNDRLPATAEKEAAVGLIVRGRIQVYSLCFDGTAVGISTLGMGECFGISNIFTGEDLSTLLVSDRKTEVAFIPKDCFFALLESTPGMMVRYATICNRKLRYLTEKIEFLTIPSCRIRLIAFLLKNNQGGVVRLEYSREQLSRILGVSRASLFRELRVLNDSGCITTEKDAISISDPAALRLLLERAS